jgi:hypothetical protein
MAATRQDNLPWRCRLFSNPENVVICLPFRELSPLEEIGSAF